MKGWPMGFSGGIDCVMDRLVFLSQRKRPDLLHMLLQGLFLA